MNLDTILSRLERGRLILGTAGLQGRQTKCAACRNRNKKCSFQNGASACEFCASRCQPCSLFARNPMEASRFEATRFHFRHQPGASEGWTENQPVKRLVDERQYYYIEWPYATTPAWAPLYVRREFEDSGGLIRSSFPGTFVTWNSDGTSTTLLGHQDTLETAHHKTGFAERLSPYIACPVSPTAYTSLGRPERSWVSKAWDLHHLERDRPVFHSNEQVLTCRRIVRVQGIFDLNDEDVSRHLQPGRYKLRWRFQHFETCPHTPDILQLLQLRELDSGLHRTFDTIQNSEGTFNPLAFPWWGKPWPDYPGVATLELHVGYRKYAKSVLKYDIDRLSATSTADQALFSHEEMRMAYECTGSLRSKIQIHSRGALKMQDQGWVHVPDWLQDQKNKQAALDMQSVPPPLKDAETLFSEWITMEGVDDFEVLDGLQPVFIVQNNHAGKWQGGFRFGGVELIPIPQVSSSEAETAADTTSSRSTDETLPDAS